jgi:hypothetical protein
VVLSRVRYPGGRSGIRGSRAKREAIQRCPWPVERYRLGFLVTFDEGVTERLPGVRWPDASDETRDCWHWPEDRRLEANGRNLYRFRATSRPRGLLRSCDAGPAHRDTASRSSKDIPGATRFPCAEVGRVEDLCWTNTRHTDAAESSDPGNGGLGDHGGRRMWQSGRWFRELDIGDGGRNLKIAPGAGAYSAEIYPPRRAKTDT